MKLLIIVLIFLLKISSSNNFNFIANIATTISAISALIIVIINSRQYHEQTSSLRPFISIVSNSTSISENFYNGEQTDEINIYPCIKFKNSGIHPLSNLEIIYGYAPSENLNNFKIIDRILDPNIIYSELQQNIIFTINPIKIKAQFKKDENIINNVEEISYFLFIQFKYYDYYNKKKLYIQPCWFEFTTKYLLPTIFEKKGAVLTPKKSYGSVEINKFNKGTIINLTLDRENAKKFIDIVQKYLVKYKT